jgi:hypothetical protein
MAETRAYHDFLEKRTREGRRSGIKPVKIGFELDVEYWTPNYAYMHRLTDHRRQSGRRGGAKSKLAMNQRLSAK